jgi:tetratricopeptide (TPR) repeat protein
MKKSFFSLAIFFISFEIIFTFINPDISHARDKTKPEQAIFPGQAEPELSRLIMGAFDLALSRDYEGAKKKCVELGDILPENPAGPTGEMVLYQVMMLENDDYEYDAEFRDAARRSIERADIFVDKAEKNDWYYTLLGATWGIQGIYYLRQDEFLTGLYYGVKGLYYMQVAEDMSDENWEAKLGIGLYVYYRSAFASFIPIPWLDQREKGIEMIKASGENREYLEEVSRIAMVIISLTEKRYDDARSSMDKLIEERPYFPVFYQFAGRAMTEKGDYETAFEYYDRMREVDPKLYLPYFKMGECSMQMEKNEAAKKWFNKFFEVLSGRDCVYKKKAEKYLKDLKAK